MSREEQIIKASQIYTKALQKPFLDGALWADRHPSIRQWLEEDDKILDKIITALMRAENVDCADYNIMYDWLYSIKERLEEQQ